MLIRSITQEYYGCQMEYVPDKGDPWMAGDSLRRNKKGRANWVLPLPSRNHSAVSG